MHLLLLVAADATSNLPQFGYRISKANSNQAFWRQRAIKISPIAYGRRRQFLLLSQDSA